MVRKESMTFYNAITNDISKYKTRTKVSDHNPVLNILIVNNFLQLTKCQLRFVMITNLNINVFTRDLLCFY